MLILRARHPLSIVPELVSLRYFNFLLFKFVRILTVGVFLYQYLCCVSTSNIETNSRPNFSVADPV
jgi:hypothetical protein